MIFLAPFICWYVFWKTLYDGFELDFDNMFPVVRDYMVMCAK